MSNTPIEQRQRIVTRLAYKLLCQCILAFFHRAEGGSGKKMTGQLHLANYFHLRISPGRTTKMRSGERSVISQLRSLCKNTPDSVTSQLLESLNHGAGGNEGAITEQHDIPSVDNLMKRFFTFKHHADNAPDHHFQRKTTLAQGD